MWQRLACDDEKAYWNEASLLRHGQARESTMLSSRTTLCTMQAQTEGNKAQRGVKRCRPSVIVDIVRNIPSTSEFGDSCSLLIHL